MPLQHCPPAFPGKQRHGFSRWVAPTYLTAILCAISLPAFADTVVSYSVLKDTTVRLGPAETHEDVTLLLKGDSVIGTGSFGGRGIVRELPPACESGWCFVMANGHYGYVPSGTFKRITTKVAPSD